MQFQWSVHRVLPCTFKMNIVRNLRNNTVLGTDGIQSELIKYGGYRLLNRIYELVRQIWEEERIPA